MNIVLQKIMVTTRQQWIEENPDTRHQQNHESINIYRDNTAQEKLNLQNTVFKLFGLYLRTYRTDAEMITDHKIKDSKVIIPDILTYKFK